MEDVVVGSKGGMIYILWPWRVNGACATFFFSFFFLFVNETITIAENRANSERPLPRMMHLIDAPFYSHDYHSWTRSLQSFS